MTITMVLRILCCHARVEGPAAFTNHQKSMLQLPARHAGTPSDDDQIDAFCCNSRCDELWSKVSRDLQCEQTCVMPEHEGSGSANGSNTRVWEQEVCRINDVAKITYLLRTAQIARWWHVSSLWGGCHCPQSRPPTSLSAPVGSRCTPLANSQHQWCKGIHLVCR